jgi:nucleotide-binding universal stress UspA family protein
MYKTLLIPTDGSELAGKAVDYGIALAKALGARVVILTVTQPYRLVTLETAMIEDAPDVYDARMAADTKRILAGAAETAKAAGVPCDILQMEDDRPYHAIIEAAGTSGADLIVMASHGRKGVSALLLGSETVKVLTHCKTPVLVHR